MRRLLQTIRLDGVLVTEIEPTEPPPPEDLQTLLDYAGGAFPAPYLGAIRQMDGFAGWFGGPEARTTGYISLDSCRSILDVMEAYKLRESGSALLPVGGDGGGECFAFDLATGEWVVVTWIELGLGDNEWRYPTLNAMLRGFLGHLDEDEIGYEVEE